MREEFSNTIEGKVIFTDYGIYFRDKKNELVIRRDEITKKLKFSLGALGIQTKNKYYTFAYVGGKDKALLLETIDKFNELVGKPLPDGLELSPEDFGGVSQSFPPLSPEEIEAIRNGNPRTVAEMVKWMHYCCPFPNIIDSKVKQRLEVIANQLTPKETVMSVFTVSALYNGAAIVFPAATVVLTSKRMIACGKRALAGEETKIVNLNNVNEVSIHKEIMLGAVVYLESITDRTGLGTIKECADKLLALAQEALDRCNEEKNAQSAGVVVNQVSAADEIRKFKELLDMGVISQEEFDTKKKQLLGL